MENINTTKNETVNKVENEKNIKRTINTILMLIYVGLLVCAIIVGGYALRTQYSTNTLYYIKIILYIPFAFFVYYPFRNYAGENLKMFNKNIDKFISDLIVIISFIFFVFLFSLPIVKIA